MVLTALHFLHNLTEEFFREREGGIFNPGNTLCLILQVLTIPLSSDLRQQIPEAFTDTRARL